MKYVSISILLCLAMLAGCCSTANYSMAAEKKKKEAVETVYEWDGVDEWVKRKEFGLVAKEVSSVKIGCMAEATICDVFIRQKGETAVKEVDFFHKEPGEKTNYRMNIVSEDARDYYPMIERILFLDRNGRLMLTGVDRCNLFEQHASKEECKKCEVVNQVVEQNLDAGKCWSDSDMFAYVKDNTLYITGNGAAPKNNPPCHKYNTVRSFFAGKADKIKKVVCGECQIWGRSNIFVLMEDGSVWGMGCNREKLISNSKKKYYDNFVKIISKGVREIAASTQNVAVIKKNGGLYVWGRSMKSKKEEYSATPQKIAKKVKEVAVPDVAFGKPALIYLKKNKTAYGMGQNSGYRLTEEYKKGWHSKPVKLMENVKHIYAEDKVTLLLTCNNELYWSGMQETSAHYAWANDSNIQDKTVESWPEWDGKEWVKQKNFGLVAKEVSGVKVGSDMDLWNVFIRQKGETAVKEVDFLHKEKGEKANYRMNVVSEDARDYYPMIGRSLFLDNSGRLLETGTYHCYLFEQHASKEACKRASRPIVNQVVEQNLDAGKCWSDSDMFAYVKDNTLYITGYAVVPKNYSEQYYHPECYKYNTVRSFFAGKADKIKEVVCGENNGLGRSNIFVLMKNGSVWGMGCNREKLISNSKKKYYHDFVKIIPKGVKEIAAGTQNVAVIKKNGKLYVWGRTMKSKKKKYSATPRKIAKKVQEVAVPDVAYRKPVLIYLKKNKTAYGIGQNSGYMLTDKYKEGWHGKPVKLMENVKHIYAGGTSTLLLTCADELYWSGRQDKFMGWYLYDWVHNFKK